MIYDDKFILGVPIIKEVNKMLDSINSKVESNLTNEEKELYRMGIYNAISALEVVLESPEEECECIIVNKPNLDTIEELNEDEIFE